LTRNERQRHSRAQIGGAMQRKCNSWKRNSMKRNGLANDCVAMALRSIEAQGPSKDLSRKGKNFNI
jgi:hypothetical protein